MSPACSFTKLANSSSSSGSSIYTTPSWAFLRKPHWRKQLVTVWSETSFHAALIQEIAFNTSTSWIISEAFLLSIQEMTNFKSLFRYLTSRGCSLDVVFLGKKNYLNTWVWNNKIFRVTRNIVHKKQDVSRRSCHLLIDFSQHKSYNFTCHPWFLTWIVMHAIRTFRVDQVLETFRFSTYLNKNCFNNLLSCSTDEKSNC